MGKKSNQCHVLKVNPNGASDIEEILQQEGIPLEPCDHAFFRARARGCTITFYRSGKVMLQGPDADRWGVRLGLPVGEARKQDPSGQPMVATIGSDESGKGDFFGPLVVAAVYSPLERINRLAEAGVQDSKALADRRCAMLSGWIEKEYATAIRVLMPTEYNRRHAECDSNLNILLATIHAECLRELLPQLENGGGRMIVDKFGPEARVEKALGKTPSNIELIQVPRAEEHPVVAAASILARAEFLQGLKRCSEAVARNLPKGCGPATSNTVCWIKEVGGEELLGKVGKLHFNLKNT